MQIDSVDIDLLIPDPDNANTHDEKNLKAIRGSLKKFGQVEPLVVRRQNNVVIGGNGRLTAMKAMNWTHATVHYVDLDDQKAKALAIALNRTSELSAFNTDVRLFLGTNSDNLKDASKKGRLSKQFTSPTHCRSGRHILEGDAIRVDSEGNAGADFVRTNLQCADTKNTETQLMSGEESNKTATLEAQNGPN